MGFDIKLILPLICLILYLQNVQSGNVIRTVRYHSVPAHLHDADIHTPGTSEYVRYFATHGNGHYYNGHSHGHSPYTVIRQRVLSDSHCCSSAVVDSHSHSDRVAHYDAGSHHPSHHHKVHSHDSHPDFVIAGNNYHYTVRSPKAHEPQAPYVGYYYGSYANGQNGGKIYLGNNKYLRF